MPASTEAVSAALRTSLLPRKGPNSEPNGDCHIDSALTSANKLLELTKNHIEYEPAENHQANSLDALKSKYVVLNTNTKTVNKLNTMNPHPVLNGGLSSGTACNGANGVSNGFNGNRVNGMKPSKGLSNGTVNGCTNSSGSDVLPQPKCVLYPAERVKLGWKNVKNELNGTIGAGLGMSNMGNTCYLNATLQALFHVPAFVLWLLSDGEHFKKCQEMNGMNHGDCVTCSMSKTLKMSQNPANSSVKPILIINKLRQICRNLGDGTQEDAHEFMRHLLENMEKAYLSRVKNMKLDTYSKETTPINQIFGGYIRTEVKCLRCNHISTTFQHFQDLILDIKKASNVEEAMDHYFAREKLDGGENAYKCEKCKNMVPATKKFSIEKPPKVLCIQLKRFSMMGGKVNKHVEHREQISLAKYMHNLSPYCKNSPLSYHLISMVIHSGAGASCGHYTALARCPSQTYHLFDDALVRPVSKLQVMNSPAYILIYEMEPMENGCVRNSQKPSTVTSLGVIGSIANGGSNTNSVNGTSKLNIGALPASNDRNHVSFGLSTKPAPTPPRIVMHQKKEFSPSVSTPQPSSGQNGSSSVGNRQSSFIGPVLPAGTTQLSSSMPSLSSSSKMSNGTGSYQHDKKEELGTKPTEAEKRLSGPLVPYDCDDDSSSRESTLSPPLDDKPGVLTVTATTSDWQVTNSSGACSPSSHSESSNHSVTSTTSSNWNVIDKLKPEDRIVRDSKLKDKLPKTNDSTSDKELKNQTVDSDRKQCSKAKIVDAGSNISQGLNFSVTRRKMESNQESLDPSGSTLPEESQPCKMKRAKEQGKQEKTNGLVSMKDENYRSFSNSRLQPHNGTDLVVTHSTAARNGSNGSSIPTRHVTLLPPKGDKFPKNDTLKVLSEMSHRGFGSGGGVRTWNGDRSGIEREVDKERQDQRKRPLPDYDVDLDRGRVKKSKRDRFPVFDGFNKFEQHALARSYDRNHQPWLTWDNRRPPHQHYRGSHNHRNHSNNRYTKRPFNFWVRRTNVPVVPNYLRHQR